MSRTRAEQAVTNLKASLKEMYDAETAKGTQQATEEVNTNEERGFGAKGT